MNKDFIIETYPGNFLVPRLNILVDNLTYSVIKEVFEV